jgi:antitoxin MazE
MYILEPMKTKLQRWGNSLGLRIPKAFAEEAGVEAGSMVDLTVDQRGRIVVQRVQGPRYELEDLLARITADSRQPEVGTGRPRGKEAW